MTQEKIAFIGNIGSISSLIASELRRQGYVADVYQSDVPTTSSDENTIITSRKIYNLPLERTLRRMYFRIRKKYDVEILSDSLPYTNAKHRVIIYHGQRGIQNRKYPRHRCFFTTKDLRQYLGDDAVFLPRCIDTNMFKPQRRIDVQDEIVVGHFTTQPQLKGTDLLVAAVKQLNNRGIRTRLLYMVALRHMMPHYIAQCHVVCDQFLSGAYGVIGIETLAMNRPVICHVKKEYFDYTEMMEQIINCNPTAEDIANAIVKSSDKQVDAEIVRTLYSPERSAEVVLNALHSWAIIP